MERVHVHVHVHVHVQYVCVHMRATFLLVLLSFAQQHKRHVDHDSSSNISQRHWLKEDEGRERQLLKFSL